MAFDKEKLAQIAKPRSEVSKARALARKKNREWLRMSQEIALFLHYYIRKNGITQRELANRMGVSAVYVGKLLKGGENLTLETICKIQEVTGECVISVARPYIFTTIMSFSTSHISSNDTINSDKYCGEFTDSDSYVTVTEEVA